MLLGRRRVACKVVLRDPGVENFKDKFLIKVKTTDRLRDSGICQGRSEEIPSPSGNRLGRITLYPPTAAAYA